jgi:pimeloyl-ACP methyl ester carboxylesterase
MRHLAIPIWREGRIALEHAALRRDGVLDGEGVPRGDGGPVLLVPGFLAGDPSLATMAGWLKRLGYRPCRSRMRANVDCTTRALDRLEGELERLAERHGRAVAIVGQSRGGTMARGLAMRRPDLVHTVVTLGSPLTDQMAIHPLVRVQVTALGALGTFGVPGLFGRGCESGDCCAETREHASSAFPAGIRFVSVYSRTDGIVDWRACLDPDAEPVEVRSSHIGMSVHPDVFRVVGRVLGERAPAAAAA